MGFKENLKSELQYKGMLVKELAAESGIKNETLDSYLSARSQLPNIEAGVKIAKALDVSVEYLVDGEDGKKSSRYNLSKPMPSHRKIYLTIP